MSALPSSTLPTDDGLVLRIVVHGAPYAGKTTTARTLGVRLGQDVVTPEEDEDGRTLLFDWMEYVGGRFDGRPIRTQLVTVPGHDPERSARLLEDADVVLFVADTRAEGIEESVAMLDDVRRQIAGLPNPIGLVVQANKRDEPTALDIEEVLTRLDVGHDTVVIETVASDGEGVRQAFVYAVRVGLRHRTARTDDVDRAASADALALDLSPIAPEAVAPPDPTMAPPPEPVPEPEREPEPEHFRLVARAEPAPAPSPERPEAWKAEPRALPRPRWWWLRRDRSARE